jgi:glyoxylase-like metal-dependent hydrolase (beta-lactamase superfamily II)
MVEIIKINLTIANAYLVKGERPILIDTGGSGKANNIVKALATHGVRVEDLALILHTHGHGDHVGSTAALKRLHPIPAAMHPADVEMAKSGHNKPFHTSRLTARLIAPFVDRPFEGITPEVMLDSQFDLTSYGVPGEVIHTPGHTPGSVSIIFNDGQAIVGDVMMGGHLGGAFLPHLPRVHYYYDDIAALERSRRWLLERGVTRFYVGHGGPLERAAVLARFGGA